FILVHSTTHLPPPLSTLFPYTTLFRSHLDNEDAKDLTQSFFTSALEREFFQRFDPTRASFRTYLRMALERFAASDHAARTRQKRSEEHTSELQSPDHLVCRLLLEKNKQ